MKNVVRGYYPLATWTLKVELLSAAKALEGELL